MTRPPKSSKAVKIGSRGNSNRILKTGATTRIRRADPYTASWKEIKEKVWVKYGGMCGKCSSTDRLEVHHIVRVARGGRNNMVNFILLCHKCHKKQPGHGHMH